MMARMSPSFSPKPFLSPVLLNEFLGRQFRRTVAGHAVFGVGGEGQGVIEEPVTVLFHHLPEFFDFSRIEFPDEVSFEVVALVLRIPGVVGGELVIEFGKVALLAKLVVVLLPAPCDIRPGQDIGREVFLIELIIRFQLRDGGFLILCDVCLQGLMFQQQVLDLLLGFADGERFRLVVDQDAEDAGGKSENSAHRAQHHGSYRSRVR